MNNITRESIRQAYERVGVPITDEEIAYLLCQYKKRYRRKRHYLPISNSTTPFTWNEDDNKVFAGTWEAR